MLKKIISIALSFCLALSFTTTSFAVSKNANDVVKENALKKIEKQNNDLERYITENIEKKNIKTLVNEYFEKANETGNAITAEEALSIKDGSNIIVKEKKLKNDQTISFYKNGIFCITSLENKNTATAILNTVPNTTFAATASGSVWGQAYKDYYSWLGLYIFTVAVGSSFNYNGTSATYGGGFTAYYQKGPISLWQVSNWEKGHGAAGNNYEAYCSGNFHVGLEVQGYGLVVQDLAVRHRVTCSASGSISTSMAP